MFITRNGSGDLVVMSIELNDRLIGRRELYAAVDKGIRDDENGRTVAADDAMQRARMRCKPTTKQAGTLPQRATGGAERADRSPRRDGPEEYKGSTRSVVR